MEIYDVLTVGDASLDAFLGINENNEKARVNPETKELCFKHGEKISVEHTYFSVGGNAANVAVGLSRLGLKATIAAEIGDDEFALKINNTLAKEHVDRSFLRTAHGQESSFSVAINFKGDRTLFSEHLNRPHEFTYGHAKIKWMYLTSLGMEWENAYEKAITYVEEDKAQLAFNPGTLQLREKSPIVEKAISIASVLIVNKEEAQKIITEYAGKQNPPEDIKEILTIVMDLGPKIVVITDGKNGSYALDSEKNFYHEGILDSKPVERTGAGDAYSSGFLSAIVYNLTIPVAMQWGSENATGVVGKIGAQAGLLTKKEIEEKVQHDYR